MFQSYALFPHRTVEENIAFGLRYKRCGRDETRRRVGEAMELVRLGGLGARRPAQLSGGQQQRVALARALVLEPPVLLLDEPLGALDARLRLDLQVELKRIQEQLGITFVYVTHDQDEALTMSDRVAVLHVGRIEQLGTPRELYEEPATAFVANFLGAANLIPVETAPADGGCRCTLGSFNLRSETGDVVAGDALAMIRPEYVRLEPHGSEGENRVPGMVEEVVYLGFHQDVRVRLATGALVARRRAERRRRPGVRAGRPGRTCTCGARNLRVLAGEEAPRVRGTDTRGELLAAARRVIRRDGFAGVTVGEITREAGASAGLLNYHFGSKDEVLAEAFDEIARGELADLEAIARRPDPPPDRLAAYLDSSDWGDREGWMLWLDAWADAARVEELRATLARYARGWRAALADVLADGARHGSWDCPDPAEAASRIVAVIDGIGLQAMLHPRRGDGGARRRLGAPDRRARAGDRAARAGPGAAGRPADVHSVRIGVRGRDLDADGSVHPAAMLAYLEEARDGWLAERLGPAARTRCWRAWPSTSARRCAGRAARSWCAARCAARGARAWSPTRRSRPPPARSSRAPTRRSSPSTPPRAARARSPPRSARRWRDEPLRPARRDRRRAPPRAPPRSPPRARSRGIAGSPHSTRMP